jgi:hypothetical protein
MSYGFNVRKVDGALVLQNHEAAAAHIPDGAVFTIGGHEPAEGTSPAATLNIALAIDVEGRPYPEHVASAAAVYNTARSHS